MRILDLGAHDGFVGTWLHRQVARLTIDGIEANSKAVEIANRRNRENGTDGRYVVGLAEDAREHFEPGSYDAVAAFELIEHVPDVRAFLETCEAMVRPGGRVYLSTPDGTFGDGQNPHHLRVYRAVDLFELCRRRGRVADMLVGHDGVSVISYTPGESDRPELAIYAGPGWEKWHPKDIESKGLGGSETAAVRLAEALSDRGYVVTVYGETDYCAWRQIQFKPHHTFDPAEERDVVIASRSPQLADHPINARVKLLWMHDTDYGSMMTPERVKGFDYVLPLSEWHEMHLLSMYPWLDEEKLVLFGNAIEPSYFGDNGMQVRPPIALYSSSPDRGLDLLLRMWPAVRDLLPTAELHYCYSSVYDRVAEQNPSIREFRAGVAGLAEQPGVVNLGSLSQNELAKKMQEVSAWLAPSWNTPNNVPFFETYCIGAQEAAAGGAVLVVSDWGALCERVNDATNSVAIPAPEDGKGIREDEWVRSIVNAMTIPVHQPSLFALKMTWEFRAEQLDEVINGVPITATAS
jgi:glycosyltransferase involved in cell wall biosynthesis